MKFYFLWGLILSIVACSDSGRVSGDHGTETPNALTVSVVDKDGAAVPDAKIILRAFIDLEDRDSVYLKEIPCDKSGKAILEIEKDVDSVEVVVLAGTGDTLSTGGMTIGELEADTLVSVKVDNSLVIDDTRVLAVEIPWTPNYLSPSWDTCCFDLKSLDSIVNLVKGTAVNEIWFPVNGNGSYAPAYFQDATLQDSVRKSITTSLQQVLDTCHNAGLGVRLILWNPDTNPYIWQDTLDFKKNWGGALKESWFLDKHVSEYLPAVYGPIIKHPALRGIELMDNIEMLYSSSMSEADIIGIQRFIATLTTGFKGLNPELEVSVGLNWIWESAVGGALRIRRQDILENFPESQKVDYYSVEYDADVPTVFSPLMQNAYSASWRFESLIGVRVPFAGAFRGEKFSLDDIIAKDYLRENDYQRVVLQANDLDSFLKSLEGL